jgi:hypothetical protein
MEQVAIDKVEINKEVFYKITNSDQIRPFFMSVVSDSNHWMFISSNGGLSAGRKNAEYALFPYYTDDKITESSDITGSKTILFVEEGGRSLRWEPFSYRDYDRYNTSRNLYKNLYGNKLIFEEINHDLGLSFRYQWASSNEFGFVKSSVLHNFGKTAKQINFIDGIQNILPFGVPSDLQNASSNLVDAYKRSELDTKTGLGIFALSAIIVDKAEPSEALKTNVAWSNGLDVDAHLVSSLQLNTFRQSGKITNEVDVKGEKGAYFIYKETSLSANETLSWDIVADVNKTHAKVAALRKMLMNEHGLGAKIKEDIELGSKKLVELNASADGLQCTSDHLRDARHFANVLFNNMRGGIFDHNYAIEKWDFEDYLEKANKALCREEQDFLAALPKVFNLEYLKSALQKTKNPDLRRLSIEYLPLRFSRRHGDPSRPWNKFSINTIDEKDGSKILDYEGNWRDIFQNWEALVHSFPDFIDGMIFRFLNASTFDGYNPYRVTKDGFDWEISEPDDPWSYIGYWGDHQIIYLLKFLEFIEDHKPGKLASYFEENLFVYANVPYKIKTYKDILKDPKDTIEFDEEADEAIRAAREKQGGDGALLNNMKGEIHRVNFIEKILATILAKLSNYIPEGGIWMNTQRPEWNDANNALVGNGVSMVTLYYLRRFLHFFEGLLNRTSSKVEVSSEMAAFFTQVNEAFSSNMDLLSSSINDESRREVLDALGQAAADYRDEIYKNTFSGSMESLNLSDVLQLVQNAKAHLEHAIEANKRNDNLYHAYNIMTTRDDKTVELSYLSEMLEGQVAVLSSGYLKAKEALSVLDAMKGSALFRPDQYSYLLYPAKQLPGFLDRNNIPGDLVESSSLLMDLLKANKHEIIEQDVFGDYHFNGNFRNAKDLEEALEDLSETYQSAVSQEKEAISAIFEEVFDHKSFTGRSGTFYGYEGLGSIYWHMVSKLLLAVQETCVKAINEDEDPIIVGRLLDHFYEINAGIGVHKSPSLYGAFPTDPYSHTPAGKGAQQPGMTGQVKEDILSRFGELGVFVTSGKLGFYPCLLRKEEFLETSTTFSYIEPHGNNKDIKLSEGSMAFTYCQIPIVYKVGKERQITVYFNDGAHNTTKDSLLDQATSSQVFSRTGKVDKIEVIVKESTLK